MVEAYFVQAVATLLVNICTGPGRNCASSILFVQLRRAASHCKRILSLAIELQHAHHQSWIVNEAESGKRPTLFVLRTLTGIVVVVD